MYGKFTNVRNYIAVVAPKVNQGSELAGYYGERVVLHAQTLGLNTCWVGLTFKNIKTAYTIAPGEELKAVISLGYGATQGVQHPQKKTIDDVTINKTNQPLPEWFVKGVESALLAPTAVNQQKFAFTLNADLSVQTQTKFSLIGYTHLDLGILQVIPLDDIFDGHIVLASDIPKALALSDRMNLVFGFRSRSDLQLLTDTQARGLTHIVEYRAEDVSIFIGT